jgi:hypothetical protein
MKHKGISHNRIIAWGWQVRCKISRKYTKELSRQYAELEYKHNKLLTSLTSVK